MYWIRSSTISHSPISGQEFPPPAGQSLEASLENKEIVRQEVDNRSPRVNPTPPLPRNNQTPPLLAPPMVGASSDDSRNPYKRTSGLSHKSSSKFKSNLGPVPTSFNQLVNLETLPDNSEHPDLVLGAVKTGSAGVQQWPQTENNEAPINDRNQYLETGQLSEVNLTETVEGSSRLK